MTKRLTATLATRCASGVRQEGPVLETVRRRPVLKTVKRSPLCERRSLERLVELGFFTSLPRRERRRDARIASKQAFEIKDGDLTAWLASHVYH